ncbi:MAG: hypothetical protein ACM3U1_00555 [Chloroflexota bacterium]
MKTASVLLAFLILFSISYSKDLIITKSGEKIRCKIEKDDSLSYYYSIPSRKHKDQKLDIRKSEVDSIAYNYEASSSGKVSRDTTASVLVGITFHRDQNRFLGAFVEFHVVDYLSAHVMGGPLGVGFGLNFHLKPDIAGPCVNFEYLYQDFNDPGSTNIIASFIYRIPYYVQFQGGVSFWMGTWHGGSIAMYNGVIDEPNKVSLLLGVGFYYPF